MTTTKGKSFTQKKFFSRETTISINIKADPSILWALLTNGSDYPRWNSTVISIEGAIEKGNKIRLKSTLDPKRIFKLKVKEYNPDQLMVWGDAMGKRTYSIKKLHSNESSFTMNEKIGGPLFPLFASMIPSFDESFEKFANDLKREAETIAQVK